MDQSPEFRETYRSSPIEQNDCTPVDRRCHHVVVDMVHPEGACVLFIEDDAAVREGVSSSLEAFGYRVHAMADGNHLSTTLAEVSPDLALLDVSLPAGPDGFEIAEHIRSTTTIPVFFLTAADDMESRLFGFDLGADDYLVKPFSTLELAVRIRAVLRRSSHR